ncbi:MAG: hypothetical protein LBS03_09290 [Bacteroidales bacterium]|nr:hypothetical protein [Bacteroidales bacterium]
MIGYILFGVGMLVLLSFVARFIGWIWERIPDARRMPSVRVRLGRIAMRFKMYKAAHDMIRAAEDATERERRSGL